MALKLCQVAPQSGSLQAGKVGGGGGVVLVWVALK